MKLQILEIFNIHGLCVWGRGGVGMGGVGMGGGGVGMGRGGCRYVCV